MRWRQDMHRSRGRALPALAILAAAAMTLAACSSKKSTSTTGTTAGGATTYALAFVGPLTGANANLGINPYDGVQVAIDQANKAGGNIHFVVKPYDTQGDPSQAPSQKDKYINDSQVLGLVGPVFSGETKAVLTDLSDQ